MKVTFSVVPPGGGEQDYSFDVDIPALPETAETERKRVRRTRRWALLIKKVLALAWLGISNWKSA